MVGCNTNSTKSTKSKSIQKKVALPKQSVGASKIWSDVTVCANEVLGISGLEISFGSINDSLVTGLWSAAKTVTKVFW